MSSFETAELDSYYDENFGAEKWLHNSDLYKVLHVENGDMLRVRRSEFGPDNPDMFQTWQDEDGKKWYVRDWTKNQYEEYQMSIVDWAPVNVIIEAPARAKQGDGSVKETFVEVDRMQAFFMPGSTEEVKFKGKIQSLQRFTIDILFNASYEYAYNHRFVFNNLPFYITGIENTDNSSRRLKFVCILPSNAAPLTSGGGFTYTFPITLS